MTRELAEILDECIKRIVSGETVETCLADYPGVRSEIEPLLYTASSVSAAPGIVTPEAFRLMSGARLLARIRREAIQSQAARRQQGTSPLDIFGLGYQWLRQALTGLTGMKRTVIPVALTVSLVLGAAIGGLRLMWAAPSLASQCTLSVLSGSVEIQAPEETSWQQGADGMTLTEGDRVRTAINSGALLTFFEGSTIKLESETDIQIQQVERAQDESIRITLKQWLGRTWSRVVKMAGTGSHYEIETPSATAVVRGTLFSTSVDEDGSTEVATTSGLVSVVAQGEEVYLPPNQKTAVQAGSPPSQPETVPAIRNELVVRATMPAVASLRDPTGSSTGTLLTGLSFNQIAGSLSSIPAEGTQHITVPDPIGGEYIVALRYLSDGTANFSIEAQADGKLVFEHSGALEADGEGGWLIRFNLKIEDNLISGGEVVGIEPLGDKAPEKIVEPEAAKESRIQSESPGQDQDNGSTQDLEQDQGSEGIQEQRTSKSDGQAQDEGKDQGQDGEPTKDKRIPDEDVDEDIYDFLDEFFKRVDEQTRDKGDNQSQPDKQDQANNAGQGQPDKQDQANNAGQGQPDKQDQANNAGQGQPDKQDQDENKGQGQPPDKQAQDNNKVLAQSDKQDQDKDKGQGQPDKQDQANNAGQGQPDKQDQDKDKGQGQPDKQDQDKDKGQGQPDKQDQDKDKGQGQPC
ncbi:MAG: FecR domain-containing protein [Dehalococcoidales bacterium]|nr:FecR domain-containing protein [Dehalococcoidales bacterium]